MYTNQPLLQELPAAPAAAPVECAAAVTFSASHSMPSSTPSPVSALLALRISRWGLCVATGVARADAAQGHALNMPRVLFDVLELQEGHDLHSCQGTLLVALVGKDQDGDGALQHVCVLQHRLQLILGHHHAHGVRGVHHKHDALSMHIM